MAELKNPKSCDVCHGYGADSETGQCRKCCFKCESGIHRYNTNYYDSCPYCEALLEHVHNS